MNPQTSNQASFSRRSLIGIGLASVTGIIINTAVAGKVHAQDLLDAGADTLLAAIQNPDAGEAGIDALAHVFARSGITVFADDLSASVVQVSGVASPLAFMRWQLATFVAELRSQSARPAGVFDNMFPAETADGDPVPTVGELLAGYYDSVQTPGADFTRAYLNQIIADDLAIDARELPAPAAIIALLGGELMGEIQAAVSTAATTIPGISSASSIKSSRKLYPLAMSTFGLSSQPSYHGNIALSSERPSLLQGSSVCGAAKSFIDSVINSVSSVLDVADSVGSIPIIGAIIDAVVRGVRLGVRVVTKAVAGLLQPVISIIGAIGAGLSIASTIIGTLTSWTVALEMRPSHTRFGIDSEVVTGEIGVTAGGWDRIDLPPNLTDCAALIGLELPKPTSKDAPVHLTVTQSSELIRYDTSDLTLDETGKATATYVTGSESAETAKGTPQIGIAYVQASVTRDDLKKLQKDLFDYLFSLLPGVVTNIVQPIVGPIAQTLSTYLLDLVTVSGKNLLFVTYHEADPTPVPVDPESGSSCVVGTFQVTNSLEHAYLTVAENITYTGSCVFTFNADGSYTEVYDGLVASVAYGPLTFTYAFEGTNTGTYTFEGDLLATTVVSAGVTASVDEVAVQMELGGGLSGGSGTIVCDDPMLWTVTIPGLGTVTFEFVRLS